MGINNQMTPNPRTALQSCIVCGRGLHDATLVYYNYDKQQKEWTSIELRYWANKKQDIKKAKEIWNKLSP